MNPVKRISSNNERLDNVCVILRRIFCSLLCYKYFKMTKSIYVTCFRM